MAGQGAARQLKREAGKREWVAMAYAGLPFPTGPNTPLPRRKRAHVDLAPAVPASRHNKHVKVVWTNGVHEHRYHFTKGYRWGRA